MADSDAASRIAAVRAELLENLTALRRAVAATAALKNLLDDRWFEAIADEIRHSTPPHPAKTDPSGFLYDFMHPLRGVDWFEKAQQLMLKDRLAEVDEESKFALWMAGIDPLRTIIPRLDERVQALSSVTFKPDQVRMKLAEVVASRTNPSLKNHLFEVGVLGDLARHGVLIDVEEATTASDGVANIDGRDILIEATNTVQRVIPDFIGVLSTDPNVEIDQVVKKIRKKVADGRQLARANGRPTVLFLARTHMGAGRESAPIALREIFSDPNFAALSAVVVADSWKLYVTEWQPGAKPDVPLTAREAEAFDSWYRRPKASTD